MQKVKIVHSRKVRWLAQGKWHQQSCRTAAEALVLRDRLADRLGCYEPATLGDVFEKYLAHRGLAAGSQGTYRRTWKVLTRLHHQRVATIEPTALAELIAGVASSDNHAHTLLKLVQSVLGFARDLGLVDRNAAKLVKLAKVPERAKRLVTDAEYLSVVSIAGPRLRVALALGRYAGLRASEAANLRWSDVDFDRGVINVTCREGWKTKSGRNRTIPIPDTLRDILTSWRLKNPFAPCLLDRQHEGQWRRFSPRRHLKKVLTRLGSSHFRYHDLRVTYLSHLANQGLNVFALAQIAGHGSIETTRKYYVAADPDAVEKVRRIV